MALSGTKLRSLHDKPYDGKSEITDIDGLSVSLRDTRTKAVKMTL